MCSKTFRKNLKRGGKRKKPSSKNYLSGRWFSIIIIIGVTLELTHCRMRSHGERHRETKGENGKRVIFKILQSRYNIRISKVVLKCVNKMILAITFEATCISAVAEHYFSTTSSSVWMYCKGWQVFHVLLTMFSHCSFWKTWWLIDILFIMSICGPYFHSLFPLLWSVISITMAHVSFSMVLFFSHHSTPSPLEFELWQMLCRNF